MKKYILPSLFLLFSFSFNAYSQIIRSKLDFIGGIGYPEFIHGGLRYQYTDITQFGLYYGGDMGIKPEIIRTWSADNFIHFGKHSYTPNRPVWYTRQGFTYSIYTTADRIFRYSFVDLAAGRERRRKALVGLGRDPVGVVLEQPGCGGGLPESAAGQAADGVGTTTARPAPS